MLNIFGFVGRYTINIIHNLGVVILFVYFSLIGFLKPPFRLQKMLTFFWEIFFFSLPLVGLTAIFTGMVLVMQSYLGFARFSAEGAIANVVVLSVVRELAPVLSGLMVAGRISGAIGAEIATMKVSEQLDALYTLRVNAIQYLISPKIVAGILAMPLLVLVADILGIMGGWFLAVYQLGFNSELYLKTTWNFVSYNDILSGVIKAFVFGFIITTMGAFFGYFCDKGSKGVGKATTNAVVYASGLILFADYILTAMLFN